MNLGMKWISPGEAWRSARRRRRLSGRSCFLEVDGGDLGERGKRVDRADRDRAGVGVERQGPTPGALVLLDHAPQRVNPDA
jgi:hypothetical protein